MRSEHDDARLPWYPLRERVAAMERTVVEVRDSLSDEAHIPQPAQRPIPVVIGAMSEAGLAVAARQRMSSLSPASGRFRAGQSGRSPWASADDTAATMDGMRAAVKGREVVFDFLVQAVSIDRDPRQAAAELARGTTGMTVEQVLDSPFVVLAAGRRSCRGMRSQNHLLEQPRFHTLASTEEMAGTTFRASARPCLSRPA